MAIEAWLPRFEVREQHACAVELPPERALAVALATPATPDRLVRILFRLRGLGGRDDTIESFASRPPFVLLERTPTTLVCGLALRFRGSPRTANDVEAWRAWARPGLKIALDVCAEPAADGSTRLTTETRVLALDRRTRLFFRAYWLAVRPFSLLVRRRWLRAIVARAADERAWPTRTIDA